MMIVRWVGGFVFVCDGEIKVGVCIVKKSCACIGNDEVVILCELAAAKE